MTKRRAGRQDRSVTSLSKPAPADTTSQPGTDDAPDVAPDVAMQGDAGSGGDAEGGAGPRGVEAYAPQGGFAVPEAGDGRGPEVPGGPLDVAITIGGIVVAVLLSFALAIFEAFLSPLRVSDLGFSEPGDTNPRIPFSLVLALVTNPLLIWFAFRTTGRRLTALLPAAVWIVVWVLAAARSTEGDLLLTDDNWVGLLTLFTGACASAVGFIVFVLRQPVVSPANSKATPLAPQSVGQVDTFPHRP